MKYKEYDDLCYNGINFIYSLHTMTKDKFVILAVNAIEKQIREDNANVLIWFNVTKIKEIVEDIIKATDYWIIDESTP